MEQVTSWPLKLGLIGCPETSVKITNILCVISQQSRFLTTATVRKAVTMRRVRVTIVYVKKKQVLHILSVCVFSLSYPAHMRRTIICGVSGSTVFFHIIL